MTGSGPCGLAMLLRRQPVLVVRTLAIIQDLVALLDLVRVWIQPPPNVLGLDRNDAAIVAGR